MIDQNHHMIAQAKCQDILEVIHGTRRPVRVLPLEIEISDALSQSFGIPRAISIPLLRDAWGKSITELATNVWKAQSAFLANSSEAELIGAIVERSLDLTETSENDELWTRRFSDLLVRELGVDEAFGARAMDAPDGDGCWSQRVALHAAELWRAEQPNLSP